MYIKIVLYNRLVWTMDYGLYKRLVWIIQEIGMDYGLYKRLVLSIDYCLWTMFQIIPQLNCLEQVTALYHIFDGLFYG